MHSEILNDRLPSLLQLAAMKAYALGRRSKWKSASKREQSQTCLGYAECEQTRTKFKDYVDLYFLLRDHFTIADITACATRLFGELFSEKMFRSQLCYFDDVDYTETVDWLIPNPPTDDEIKLALTEIAVLGLEASE